MSATAEQPRTYEVRTYGCQMNVHDSERMAGLLEQAGYEPTSDDAEADPGIAMLEALHRVQAHHHPLRQQTLRNAPTEPGGGDVSAQQFNSLGCRAGKSFGGERGLGHVFSVDTI